MKRANKLRILAGASVLVVVAMAGYSHVNRLHQEQTLEAQKETAAAGMLAVQAFTMAQLFKGVPDLFLSHANGLPFKVDKSLLQDVGAHAPSPPPKGIDFFEPNSFGQEPCIAFKALGDRIRVFVSTEGGQQFTDDVAQRVAAEVGKNFPQPPLASGLPVLTTTGDRVSNPEGTWAIDRKEFEPACHVETGHVVTGFDIHLTMIQIPQPGQPT